MDKLCFVHIGCSLSVETYGLEDLSHTNFASSLAVEVLLRCGFECTQLEETMH